MHLETGFGVRPVYRHRIIEVFSYASLWSCRIQGKAAAIGSTMNSRYHVILTHFAYLQFARYDMSKTGLLVLGLESSHFSPLTSA
jgi:hypothetical protein